MAPDGYRSCAWHFPSLVILIRIMWFKKPEELCFRFICRNWNRFQELTNHKQFQSYIHFRLWFLKRDFWVVLVQGRPSTIIYGLLSKVGRFASEAPQAQLNDNWVFISNVNFSPQFSSINLGYQSRQEIQIGFIKIWHAHRNVLSEHGSLLFVKPFLTVGFYSFIGFTGIRRQL